MHILLYCILSESFVKTSKPYNSSLFRLLKFICLTFQVSIAKAVCVSLPSGVKLCITVLRFAFHSTEPAVKRDEMFVIREENGSVLSSVAMNKLQDEQWLTGVNPTHAVNMLLGATQNEICFSRTKCTSTLLSKNLHSFIMIKISCQYAVSSKSLRPPVEMHFHYNLYISIIYWVESWTEN